MTTTAPAPMISCPASSALRLGLLWYSVSLRHRPKRPQINEHILDMLVALRWVLCERLSDNPLELHRHIAPPRRERLRLVVQNRIHHRRFIVARKRPLPRDHLVEHDAERPDVGAAIDLFPRCLLRRHVRRRAERRVGLRELRVCPEPRETEVQDLRLAPRREHDVPRLDVPVNDPLLVRLVQPLADLDRDRERLIDRERPPLDPILETLPLNELHRDERLTLVLVDLVISCRYWGD